MGRSGPRHTGRNPVIHAWPVMVGTIAAIRADGRFLDDAAGEDRPEDALVAERIADAKASACVERRHPGRRPRPARRPVDRAGPRRRSFPIERPGRDGDDVPHAVRRVVGRPGQLADRDAGEPRLVRMDHRQLLGGRRLDHLGDADDIGTLVGREPQPEALGVRDHVEHPAIRDVDGDGPERTNFDRHVKVRREGGDIPERHPGHLPVGAVAR